MLKMIGEERPVEVEPVDPWFRAERAALVLGSFLRACGESGRSAWSSSAREALALLGRMGQTGPVATPAARFEPDARPITSVDVRRDEWCRAFGFATVSGCLMTSPDTTVRRRVSDVVERAVGPLSRDRNLMSQSARWSALVYELVLAGPGQPAGGAASLGEALSRTVLIATSRVVPHPRFQDFVGHDLEPLAHAVRAAFESRSCPRPGDDRPFLPGSPVTPAHLRGWTRAMLAEPAESSGQSDSATIPVRSSLKPVILLPELMWEDVPPVATPGRQWRVAELGVGVSRLARYEDDEVDE